MTTPQYCSKGHENPSGSRFCHQCGEQLELPVSQGVHVGLVLGDRYRVVRELGHGGFGRTYLAEDINRFNELCVLKEFSPQVQSAYVLQKAEELFEREAGVLYKLQHPQIPRFRELFRVNLNGKGYLFLVQDYVEGRTYRDLLETRKQQGLRFNEAEVTQMLLQILPVLEYIHAIGVIHRDISPDNLILRNLDWLPVLIDFGGVKQVAATVVSQFNQLGAGNAPSPTLLGKIGYAPDEQMRTGTVYPHSDLYALAVTVLVLLTGKEPQELIDGDTLTWNWQRTVNLSPTLGAVLAKMLSQRMGDRYQSARQVLQVLTGNSQPPVTSPTQPPLHTESTEVVSPPYKGTGTNTQQVLNKAIPSPVQSGSQSVTPGKILIGFLLVVGLSGVGFWAGRSWIQSRNDPSPGEDVSPPPTDKPNSSPTVEPTPAPQFSAEERNRKERLRQRREQLGINYNFYTSLVNQLFWDKNPAQRGRTLGSSPEEARLRAEWDKTAAQVLDQLRSLSAEARRQLGTYTAQDRDRWKVEVNKLNVSSRSLYDLADATFFELFPQERGKNFIDQPIGQVWQAIASDKLNAILAGTAFRKVVFDSGATGQQVSGSLKPGEGKVYIAGLGQDQLLELNLQANSEVLISVYSPTGKTILLEDSRDRTWSGTLPEPGFYEFVVVSTASKPADYRLDITAENPAPIETPTPTESPTQTPTAEPSPTDTLTPSPSPDQTVP